LLSRDQQVHSQLLQFHHGPLPAEISGTQAWQALAQVPDPRATDSFGGAPPGACVALPRFLEEKVEGAGDSVGPGAGDLLGADLTASCGEGGALAAASLTLLCTSRAPRPHAWLGRCKELRQKWCRGGSWGRRRGDRFVPSPHVPSGALGHGATWAPRSLYLASRRHSAPAPALGPRAPPRVVLPTPRPQRPRCTPSNPNRETLHLNHVRNLLQFPSAFQAKPLP
jgi:hypothetical protein